ncbi:MAG: type III-B CRISPR module RAMP protein Cmr4 [Anaerolineales bacterium]|nr:type III-B CRISPR module RAMP protein Cmr4 [Anaerolineales bacterium]
MFEEKRMMFLYVETPLHVGAGKGAGGVDLPIQRERVTGYPMVQSSGVKGCLRDVYRDKECGGDDNHENVKALFGEAGNEGQNYAGAVAPGDARLLLFPVRSLAGVFAWTTSIHALESFKRSAGLTDQSVNWLFAEKPDPSGALVSAKGSDLVTGTIVLEEYSYTAKPSAIVDEVADWLVECALPTAFSSYWKDALPKRLCILPEDDFRDFCAFATEIQTHVKLDPATKTASNTALWTTESLPVDTLLYAPLMATGVRNGSDPRTASDVLNELADMKLTHLQLGGDETTGQGWVATRFYPEMPDVRKKEEKQ